MTSIDDTSTRMDERAGMFRKSLVFRRRLSLEVSMNLSTSVLLNDVYS
jgi:hypothetical protein